MASDVDKKARTPLAMVRAAPGMKRNQKCQKAKCAIARRCIWRSISTLCMMYITMSSCSVSVTFPFFVAAGVETSAEESIGREAGEALTSGAVFTLLEAA